MVLETAIRDACAKLDPAFAFAERFDEAAHHYVGLVWQKPPGEPLPPAAVLVRPDVAITQLRPVTTPAQPATVSGSLGGGLPEGSVNGPAGIDPAPPAPPAPPAKVQLRRFYGSVEIDIVRPVKAFDAILSAVVMELQRTSGAKVTLTLEIDATAPDGFADADMSVVRDNARQLKFKDESTGFE